MGEAASHAGGCHCGKVRFEVTTDPTQAMACNCSICAKHGLWLTFVNPEPLAPFADVIAAGIIPAGFEMMDQAATRAVEDFARAGYRTDVAAVLPRLRAAATLAKIFPGLLGVLLLMQRRWRAVGFTCLAAAAVSAASAPAASPRPARLANTSSYGIRRSVTIHDRRSTGSRVERTRASTARGTPVSGASSQFMSRK